MFPPTLFPIFSLASLFFTFLFLISLCNDYVKFVIVWFTLYSFISLYVLFFFLLLFPFSLSLFLFFFIHTPFQSLLILISDRKWHTSFIPCSFLTILLFVSYRHLISFSLFFSFLTLQWFFSSFLTFVYLFLLLLYSPCFYRSL